MTRICDLPDCEAKHFCKGYCRRHYERFVRHGDPAVALKAMSPRGAPLAWLKGHVAHEGADCLIWPFARHPDGRAHMRMGGRTVKPSRQMCELVHGPAPTPQHEAAHGCGNGHGGCVHPRHLRWATPVENAADKRSHGTIIAGERHYAARLTEVEVRAIRASSSRLTDLARKYGVGLPCIQKVRDGDSWRHVQ